MVFCLKGKSRLSILNSFPVKIKKSGYFLILMSVLSEKSDFP